MKAVICLLAFFAFEMVFASQFQDFFDNSVKQINDVKTKTGENVQAVTDAASKHINDAKTKTGENVQAITDAASKQMNDVKTKSGEKVQSLSDATRKKGKDLAVCQKFLGPLAQALLSMERARELCNEFSNPMSLAKCGMEIAKVKSSLDHIQGNVNNCLKVVNIPTA